MGNPTLEGFAPPGTALIPVLDTHTHYFVFSSRQGLEGIVLRNVSVPILTESGQLPWKPAAPPALNPHNNYYWDGLVSSSPVVLAVLYLLN